MGRGWGAAGFRVEDFNVFWVLESFGVCWGLVFLAPLACGLRAYSCSGFRVWVVKGSRYICTVDSSSEAPAASSLV